MREKSFLFNSRQTVCILFILSLFFLFNYYYATKINLWGDEVASILRAQGFWLDIVRHNESHLPSYFYFLLTLVKKFS